MVGEPRRVRVTVAHRPPDRPVLRVSAGDLVSVGELDRDWPAFRWCVSASGVGGWVPDRHLEPRPDGGALVHRPYDTTELAADVGAVLVVLETDEESEWLWCEDAAGERGWVPTRSVEPAADC